MTLDVPVMPPIVTVTVNEAEAVIAVGVPLISQFVVERLKPVGKPGNTVQLVTVPPVVVAVSVVIAAFFVAVTLELA